MSRRLSMLVKTVICIFAAAGAYFAFTSAAVEDFFAGTPLFILAIMGTVGGLIVTGLMLLSIKIAVKKRRK